MPAPAHIQSKGTSTSTGASSANLTFDSATTTGNAIIVVAAVWSPSTHELRGVVSDNKGNTYAPLCRMLPPGGGKATLSIYGCFGITGGSSHQITVTGVHPTGVTNYLHTFSIFEVSNVNRAHRWVKQMTSATPGGGTHSSGSITTTIADCFLIAGFAHDAYNNSPPGPEITEDGTWNLVYEWTDSTTRQSASFVYKIVSSTGTYSHSWTLADADNDDGGKTHILALAYVAPPTLARDPLRVHADGRYLIDQSNNPVLLMNDSPQGMLVNLSTTEMQTYFSTRAAQGVVCSQIHVTAGTSFGGTSDGKTYDGIAPFTEGTTLGDYNALHPNPLYFDRLDSLLSIAASNGITVMLTAFERMNSAVLFVPEWSNEDRPDDWGRWLGMRYKDWPNIIWAFGNDFQEWESTPAWAVEVVEMMNAMQAVDPNHLRTAWLDYPVSDSRDSSTLGAESELDFVYTYYASYHQMAIAVARSPAKPAWLGESEYEGELSANPPSVTGTARVLRQQMYWAMLAGGCGFSYMNGDWGFGTGWEDRLTGTAVNEFGYALDLFLAYQWWKLVSDDQVNTVLTAGYGTRGTGSAAPDDTPDDNTYAIAARASDGSFIFAYVPEPRTITIDMTELTPASVRARWYNPTTGAYTAIGTYPNTGTQDFTLGSGDAVLVLDEVPTAVALSPAVMPREIMEGRQFFG